MTTSVGVLGPGRVGTTLALALASSPDHEVRVVAGRGKDALRAFATALPGVEVVPPAFLDTDLVLVAVPDDALVPVVRQAVAADAVVPGSRWVHVVGSAGAGALHAARLAGARVAACHPAQTFPDPATALRTLPGTTWAVTAAPSDRGWASDLVRDLGGVPLLVPEDRRSLYHAALTVGANGATSVVALARDLLLAVGVRDPGALLEPLVVAAARNGATQGVAALTGPVRRGDAGTVRAHLADLAVAMPEAVGAYRALAELAVGQSARAGLSDEAVAALRDALADGAGEVGA